MFGMACCILRGGLESFRAEYSIDHKDFFQGAQGLEFLVKALSKFPHANERQFDIFPCQWHVHNDTEKCKE